MKTGIELIAIERQRQINTEGWTPEHDAKHKDGELAIAASCYAIPGDERLYFGNIPENWPWDEKWWKPANCEFSHDENYKEERIKELSKAGALIAAEIDRIQAIEVKPAHINDITDPKDPEPQMNYEL